MKVFTSSENEQWRAKTYLKKSGNPRLTLKALVISERLNQSELKAGSFYLRSKIMADLSTDRILWGQNVMYHLAVGNGRRVSNGTNCKIYYTVLNNNYYVIMKTPVFISLCCLYCKKLSQIKKNYPIYF